MPTVNQFITNHPDWTEFIIGVAVAVAASALVGLIIWLAKTLSQAASLRIGANWTWEGTAANPAFMNMHPNVSVISRPSAPKVIVHSIWVKESKNLRKPGKIYGKVDLTRNVPTEDRTTGGDPLNFVGPTITCPNLKAEVEKAMQCPVWIQTSDDRWYKAQSMGNPPGIAERVRGWFHR